MNEKVMQFNQILTDLTTLFFRDLPNPVHEQFLQLHHQFQQLTIFNHRDSYLLTQAWIQFYQGDFIAAQQSFSPIVRQQLPNCSRHFFDTLFWILRLQVTRNLGEYLDDFAKWQATASDEHRIFAECFLLKRLGREPKLLFQLEKRLLSFQGQVAQLSLPICALATYFIADTYTSVIDKTELGLHSNMYGFQLAQKNEAAQLEFAFLHNIGMIYRNNHLTEEALSYLLRALDFHKQNQTITATQLIPTYYHVILTYLENNQLERAQTWQHELSLFANKIAQTLEIHVYVQLSKLFLKCYQPQATFETVWQQFLHLSDTYLTLDIRLLPHLETDFLNLEAFIHEQFHDNPEQLLYIYLTHLNILHEHAPGKHLAIASLYKKIATAYKSLADYLLAWSYYQAYDDCFTMWHLQNFSNQFKSEYDAFDRQLQQQQLEKIEASTSLLKQHHQYDPLTKLFTRQVLYQELEATTPTACAILDCDYFKQFNDTFGHQNGDRALKTVASVILQELSPDYKAFRYGGEEFLLLYYGNDYQLFSKTLIQLVDTIGQTPIELSLQTNTQTVTVSIGANWQQQPEFDFEVAFQLADQALYQVKANGRNHVRFN